MKHNPILLDKLKRENMFTNSFDNKNQSFITNSLKMISVAGAGSRVGCTHTVFQIAYFLSRSNFKVACLQLNESTDFQFFNNCNYKKAFSDNSFRLKNIDFYYNTSIFDIKNMKFYDFLVLDLGRIRYIRDNVIVTSESYEYMSWADLSILVCNSKPWQYKDIITTLFKSDYKKYSLLNSKYDEYIADYEKTKNWRLYFNFSDEESFYEVKQFLSQYWNVYSSVYSPNLFEQNNDALDKTLSVLLHPLVNYRSSKNKFIFSFK